MVKCKIDERTAELSSHRAIKRMWVTKTRIQIYRSWRVIEPITTLCIHLFQDHQSDCVWGRIRETRGMLPFELQ